MPTENSATLATQRTSPYKVTGCRIAWFVGDVIASGDITATPTFPTTAIAVSYTVGSEADVQRGMHVVVRNAAGDVKGTTHVRAAGAITSSSLPIMEDSNAKLALEAGDSFEACEEYRLVPNITEANELFLPGGMAYTDQNLHPPPVTCSGGHWAGTVDAGLAYALVYNAGGAFSYLVDPASVTPGVHNWILPSGIAFHSGSANTDPSPVLEVSPGSWVAYHDFTDPDNGKTTRQAVTYVCDSGDGTYAKECIATIDGNGTDNDAADWSATVEVLESVDVADVPLGCLAVVYVGELVGSSSPLLRSFNVASGRSHILMAGYVRSVTSDRTADGEHLTLQIISPLARLREMTSYSKYMVDTATPAKWSEVNELSVKRAYIQIIQFYTRLIESGWDFVASSGFVDYPYKAFTLQKSSFLGQILELALGDDARFAVDPQGRITIHTHPALYPETSRSALTNASPFTVDDVYPDYSIEWSEWETVEYCRVVGVTQGDDPQPVKFIYPGKAPGMGTDAPTVERCIFSGVSADDKARAGRHGGRFDQVFVDADGARSPIPTLTVKMPGVYSYFFFDEQYVQFDLPNDRNVDLTAYRFYPTRLSYQVTNTGDMEVSGTFVGASNAPAAEVDPITPGVITVIDPPIQPPPPVSDPKDPNGLGKGIANIALFTSSMLLKHTATANRSEAAGGVSVTASITLTGLSGWGGGSVLEAFEFDPSCPFALTNSGAVNGVLLTDTHFQRITNVKTVPPSLATAQAIGATSVGGSVSSSRWVAGWFVVAVYIPGTGVRVWASLDNGDTWSSVSVPAAFNNYDSDSAFKPRPGLEPIPGTNKMMLTVYITTDAIDNQSTATYTIDTSDTITLMVSPPVDSSNVLAGCIRTCATRDGSTVYYGAYAADGLSLVPATVDPAPGTIITNLGGGNWNVLGYTDGGTGDDRLGFKDAGGKCINIDSVNNIVTPLVREYVDCAGGFHTAGGSAPLQTGDYRWFIGTRVTGTGVPEVEFHAFASGGTSPEIRLMRNAVDITPQSGGVNYGVNPLRNASRSVSVADADQNVVMLVGVDGYAGLGVEKYGVWVTALGTQIAGAGSSYWSEVVAPSTAIGWRGTYMVSDDLGYVIGDGNYGGQAFGVWQRSDPLRIDNRTGNLGTVQIVSICGIG